VITGEWVPDRVFAGHDHDVALLRRRDGSPSWKLAILRAEAPQIAEIQFPAPNPAEGATSREVDVIEVNGRLIVRVGPSFFASVPSHPELLEWLEEGPAGRNVVGMTPTAAGGLLAVHGQAHDSLPGLELCTIGVPGDEPARVEALLEKLQGRREIFAGAWALPGGILGAGIDPSAGRLLLFALAEVR
jgi:hypothetical protein